MRKAMVTRGFKATECSVLCMDLDLAEPCNKEITVVGTYKDEAKLFKACASAIDNEHIKAVKVVDAKEVETLYGMDVQKFINESVILDPETRKEIVEATDADVSDAE